MEVALVNQLLDRGSFELVNKRELQAARDHVDSAAGDWNAVARKAGADLALRAKVLEFSADTRDCYSSEEIEDSQLDRADVTGRPGGAEQVFRGRMRLRQLQFQRAVAAYGAAVAAAGIVGGSGEKELLGHVVFLSVRF